MSLAFHDALLAMTAWLVSNVSDGATPLLRFLLRVGFVERPETILSAAALVWTFSPAPDADELSLILYAE